MSIESHHDFVSIVNQMECEEEFERKHPLASTVPSECVQVFPPSAEGLGGLNWERTEAEECNNSTRQIIKLKAQKDFGVRQIVFQVILSIKDFSNTHLNTWETSCLVLEKNKIDHFLDFEHFCMCYSKENCHYQ